MGKIVKEYYMTREDGVNIYVTYSDEGKNIMQVETGAIYKIARDIENAPFTYVETDEEPENDTQPLEIVGDYTD